MREMSSHLSLTENMLFLTDCSSSYKVEILFCMNMAVIQD